MPLIPPTSFITIVDAPRVIAPTEPANAVTAVGSVASALAVADCLPLCPLAGIAETEANVAKDTKSNCVKVFMMLICRIVSILREDLGI